MQDMMKMYNMDGMGMDMFGASETLVLNANHPLVTFVLDHPDGRRYSHVLRSSFMIWHCSPTEACHRNGWQAS